MISPTEALVLSLLMENRAGAYGSELIHASEGKLKRGSVYTILNRLEEMGFVKAKENPATVEYALPRTSYQITGLGIRGRAEFGQWTGLIPMGVLA